MVIRRSFERRSRNLGCGVWGRLDRCGPCAFSVQKTPIISPAGAACHTRREAKAAPAIFFSGYGKARSILQCPKARNGLDR